MSHDKRLNRIICFNPVFTYSEDRSKDLTVSNNGKLFIHHHEKAWTRNIKEEIKWLNVQNVEPTTYH
jgi:hypothetical protein